MMTNIIPSKPFENYAEIAFLAAKAKGKVERIQVDICDGEYVKNVSWPFTETSKNDFAKLYQKKELDVFMPEWEDLNYTADLMCIHPEKYIDTFAAYGFDEVIFHYRSLMQNKNIQEEMVNVFGVCQKYDIKVYFAVDVKTNITEFINFIKTNFKKYPEIIAGVQVMGIENIGMQGQEFELGSLVLVEKIKELFFEQGLTLLKILFDGGINEENLLEIKNAGVDVFCVGHLLTGGDFQDNLKFIKKIIN